MSEFYDDRQHYKGLSDSDLDNRYLALSGINQYPLPLKLIPGSPSRPSLSSQNSNRDGLYFPSEGVIGFVRNGVPVFWLMKDIVRFFDRFGNYTDLYIDDVLGNNYSVKLPSHTGTLAILDSIVSEQLAGTKDGVNVNFTTTYVIHSVLDVKLNGVGDTSLVTWASNNVTWVGGTIPNVGDSVQIIYVRI